MLKGIFLDPLHSLQIFINQYSEKDVMHFLFSLLRIKDLYMFRALRTHPLEALLKRYLVYCVRVMSGGCTRIGVALVPLQSNAVCATHSENEQVII
jgi:hypothetical protein